MMTEEPREELCTCRKLTVQDIPGSEIDNIEKACKTRLKFWLRCRDLKFKSSDTKAELLSRVRNNLTHSLNLVDPDPGKCYTKQMKSQCLVCCQELCNKDNSDNVENTQGVWTTSTNIIPNQFSYIHIETYTRKSAKDKKTIMIEKPLKKGYKLFFENYVFDVVGKVDINNSTTIIKGKSYRSQKKSKAPHNMSVNLSSDGNIARAKCSCVAGASGFCNHVMALLYFIDHTVKLNSESFPKVGTCTDNPQQWHKPRTQGIRAEPIMGCNVIQPKYEKKKFSGIQSTLYEARQLPVQNNCGALILQEKLKESFPNLGFTQVFSESNPTVPTKIDSNVPLGSILSYQLSLTEGHTQVLTNFPPLPRPLSIFNSFPDLPYSQSACVSYAGPFNVKEESFLNTLSVVNPSLIEQETRGQRENVKWFDMRKNRLTSSNFGLVCKRNKMKSQESFIRMTLLNKKDLSHIPAVRYGVDNESKAATMYDDYMRPLQILDCGTVIHPNMPWLSASPDRKVIDRDHGFGLVEIKCPYALRNLRPEDACKDPHFYCEIVDGKPKLKQRHEYFYQIQGQLGICGLAWCDFVVLFQKGLIIERIKFDKEFWDKMIRELTVYYYMHMLQVLSE